MSVGGPSSGSAATLDMGTIGVPADNTYVRTDTVAGGALPYWSAWWKFTATETGFVTLSTGDTEYDGVGFNDTLLYVFNESGGGPGTRIALDDDSGPGRTSFLQITVSPGTYWVQVGSYDSDGDGITVFHLSAVFTALPNLPPNRTYTVPGGTVTDPGLVMGPTVVGAPVMPPLSVSTPTDGTLPDATFVFDASPYLEAAGIPAMYVFFDSTLSYLTNGTADEDNPVVGLNVWSVSHGLPFTYEEDWDTIEIGQSSGVDDYGRSVPRGQQMVRIEAGHTYIIQLTTPPGNNVRFILRVSDIGNHTGLNTIPDQTWRVSGIPLFFDADGDSVPTNFPNPENAYVKNEDLLGFGTRNLAARQTSVVLTPFGGSYGLGRGFANIHFPGSDAGARDCAWAHARRERNTGTHWWTSDGTVGAPPTTTPVCGALGSVANADGGTITDGTIGWRYQSSTTDGSGHETNSYEVYNSQFRVDLEKAFKVFGATAGVDPSTFEAPDGYQLTNAQLTGSLFDPADLIAVKVHFEKIVGRDSASQTLRFYCQSVDYDNTDGHQDPSVWGPTSDADTNHWKGGGASSPEAWATSQPFVVEPGAWYQLPDTLLAEIQAKEAAETDYHYNGGLRIVGMFTEQFTDTVPSPGPALTLGETITQYEKGVYPIVQMVVQPTVQYWFADYPTLPVADVYFPVYSISGVAGTPRTRFVNPS